MSSSSENPLVRKLLKSPTLENQDGCFCHVFVAKQQTPCGRYSNGEERENQNSSESSMDDRAEQNVVREDEERTTQIVVRAEYIEEGNEGFRTPTSVEYRVPAIKHCPPAPRKPRAHPSRKRPTGVRRGLQFVRFSEADQFFICPETVALTAGQVHHKIKRART